MAKIQDLTKILGNILQKVDLAKLQRLDNLIPELKDLDELLGHNAETARDQLKNKADALMVSLPNTERDQILNLLPRIDYESLTIASRLLEYNLPPKILLFLHLNDLLVTTSNIPLLRPELSFEITTLLGVNPQIHLVLLSHDSADVASVLASSLVGKDLIDNGQVSIIYESGMGLYLGLDQKQKKDYTADLRKEVLQVIERMTISAASRMNDNKFKEQFYFSASEYSLGIKVHPFARGRSADLDKQAAKELVKVMAMALADLVKEEIAGVENHAYNHFLKLDESLKQVFNNASDERVWDMEKVDEYLNDFRFVHLGERGSIIRPTDATDVPAAKTLYELYGPDALVISASDSNFTLPLMQWTIEQPSGMIACSENAEKSVKDLVEGHGGIEYRPDQIDELLKIIDAFAGVRAISK